MKIVRLFMIWITVAGFAASLHAQTTQQVTAIQYYYNTDPGVGNAGNGAIFSVTPAANIDQVFPFNVPATLANGFHYLYVRAQDELGRWSLTERRLFVIQSITATENITDYAYYFDTDPGVGNAGNGAIVPVTSTANFSATVAITVPPSLTEGFHYLYVRTRDLSGQWSLIERRLFVIQSITATENITDYAYYFDTDPGAGNPGNGAIVPVSPTANFSATVAITVPATLTNGFHYLYIRTRDVSGQWSLSERRLFVTQAITPAEDITALEWYIDTDPGVGNGNPYPVVPATGEVNATLDLGGVPCLSPGTHYLYVRAKNTAGRWSIIERLSLALVAPEINVLGNAITIVDGDVTPVAADGTDFGQPLPSVPVLHTFTIVNNGTSPLTISSLSMSGAEASSFTIAGISTPLTLAVAGSTTFTVSFAAVPVGNYNAMLNINSNDCDEAIYNFALHAEVSCQPAAFSVCPANISVNNTANQCSAAVTYTATVTGDPAPVVTYTFTGATTGSGSGTGSGSTFNKGTTTVTINATNACGNVNCSFTVTVNDNQPPTIVCAAPVTINTTPGLCTGTTTLTPPTASDNCTVNGNALNFDGVNDYVNIPHSASLAIGSNPVSVECWFTAPNVNQAGFIVAKRQPVGPYNMLAIFINDGTDPVYNPLPGKKLTLTFGNAGSSSFRTITTVNNIVDGGTHHLAAVVDPVTQTLKLYIDGVLQVVNTINPGVFPSVNNTDPFTIGQANGNSWFLNFKVDELRIWNTARTQAQIQANMNNELNAQAGLVAAYHFNQGVAAGNNAGITTAFDASGNGNNGTLNNFALSNTTSNWVGGNVSSAPVVTNNAPATYPIGNTTVTWTATDANNNTATCTQVVTVVDNQPPTIVCAAPVNINTTPGLCTGTTTLTPPTVTDNCNSVGNALSFAGGYVDIPNAPLLNPFNEWTLETWVKTTTNNTQQSLIEKYDNGSNDYGYLLRITSGNKVLAFVTTNVSGGFGIVGSTTIVPGTWYHLAATFNRTTGHLKLYVNGILDAQLTGISGVPITPSAFSLKIGARGNDAATRLSNGGIMDEIRIWSVERTLAQIQGSMNSEQGAQSGLVALYHLNQGIAGGNNVGVTTATDASGNSLTGNLISFALTGTTSNWVNGKGFVPTVVNNAPTTYPIGNTTVTWTATDASNNTITCTQVVTVIAPDINVTGNAITIFDGDNSPSATDDTDFGQPLPSVPVLHTFTIENNGTAPLNISSLSMSGADPSSFTIGGITTPLTLAAAGSTTFTVSFAAGPVGNYNAMLNINSNDCDEAIYNFALHAEVSCQPAAFSVCPANISVNTTTNQCNAAVTYTATVTGDPAPVVTYTFTGATTGSGSGTGSGSTFNKGTTTVTINATNACGNVNCSFTVTVVDNQPPATPTLANVTVGECSGTPTAPTTTDNCFGPVTGTTTTVFPITTQGTTVVTWTFDDGNGNSTTANQNVIVDDVTAPVTPTLADVTVGECSGTPTAPTTTDVCAGTIPGTTTTVFPITTQGTTVVTWTFNDGNGNSTTANQNVIVDDVTAPATPTLANVIGECSATATVPTTTDNCAGTVTGTTTTVFPITTQGTTVVTWTFNDGNGNSTTANQNVIVDDVTAPVTPTLADVTVGECSGTPTAPTTTDNCVGPVTGTTTTVFPITTQGTTVVTWTFNDGNGNSTTANQNVIVDDVTPPVTPTLAAVTVGECSGTPTAPTTTDNCAGTITGTTTTVFPITTQGTTVVTWTFNDGNGNTTTANQNVIVDDVTAPVTPTLADVTVGECSGTPTAPTTTDNCVVTITGTTTTVFPITTQGTTVVTWTFNDGNGNSTTANQNVIVDDVTAPVTPTLADVTVGECSGTPTAPTTTDVCAGTIPGTTTTVFPITTQGTTVVTWTFNDGNGNSTTANQNVIVDDVTAPVTPTLADVTVGECSGTPTAPTTTDNCAGTITGTTTTVFPITTQGTTVVTWTFNDGNGNSTTANQNVIVDDVTAPVTPTLSNVTVGECSGTPTAPTTTDVCAGTIPGTTTTVFPITTQGTTVVTWTFNDGNGNTTTANQNVIVDDVTPPATPVLANITGECSATATAPTTTDNCAGTITGTTSDPLSYSTQGTHIIHWTFDDGNGNPITVNQNVIVDDVTPPATPVLANVTGECSATATAPTTTDNCAGTITGTTSDPLSYSTQGTHIIHWTFDDGNGNPITVNQNVIVDDVTPPATPVLANVTGECSATATAPTTTDNCAGTITGTTSDPLSYSTQGTHIIHWTFDDGNGNPITVNQNVIVDDITPPTINCPANIVLSACQPTATWAVPTANDNCAGFTVVQIAGPAPGASFANGTTTTITYRVTDAGNNQTSCSFTVSRDAILTGTYTATAILCYSDSATIQLTGYGGSAPYTFTNPAGVITITNPTGVYTNGSGLFRQAAGTVVYTITDANNCTVDVPVTIGQPSAIMVTTTPTNASCSYSNNGSINLSVSGGTPGSPVAYTYSWTGPNGFAATTQNISGLAAGIYHYTVTDGNNCSISSDIIITKPTEIIVSETHTAVACLLGGVSTVTISATGGTLPYSSGIGNFSQIPGSHTYTVTDANGCTGTYTLVIVAGDYTAPTFTRPADIVIPFTAGAACYNASLTVTGDVTNEQDDVTPSGPGLQATYTDMVMHCGFKTVIKRTWHLQDGCGNEAADQIQTITVTDNNTPYLIFAKKEAKFGKNSTINGSVGVAASNGKAEFDKDSKLLAPEFVRAVNITVQSGATVTNRIFSAANDGPNPAFYKYSGSTHGLGNLKISNSTATPVSGNYKNLTVKKDVTVTITGTLYGKIEIEPGATVTFSPVSGIVNIGTLKIRGKRNDVTKIKFGGCTSVRVDKKVDLSENVWLNEEGQRVTFYLGDDQRDEGKFYVHGGNTRVTANIYIKDGRLKVNGGDRDRSDGDRDCDDDERDNSEYNSGPTIMTGWFIVEKLHSDGKFVTWNRNLCDTSSFGTGGGIITRVPAVRSQVKDEYFDVKVLPNPSTTNFRLLVLSYGLEPVTVRVYTANGALVTNLDKIPRGNIITVGSDYRGGTYFAEVTQGNKRKTVKLVKMN